MVFILLGIFGALTEASWWWWLIYAHYTTFYFFHIHNYN
jgi:hypothetical protein